MGAVGAVRDSEVRDREGSGPDAHPHRGGYAPPHRGGYLYSLLFDAHTPASSSSPVLVCTAANLGSPCARREKGAVGGLGVVCVCVCGIADLYDLGPGSRYGLPAQT